MLLILNLILFSEAQIKKINGFVKNEYGQPIPHAAVGIVGINHGTYTNENGYFEMYIPQGVQFLVLNVLGYKSRSVDIKKLDSLQNLIIVLKEDLLVLDEITVVPEKTNSKEGTSVYKIENQAIKQVQAMNLADALRLIPGNKINPPDLTDQQQVQLRTAISSDVNSFGTAIMIDGAVFSNDANLQAKDPASSFAGGKASAGRGIDLRYISIANVQSIEVISGVASPKYGNLSTGGILVKSKVGSSPLIANVNVTSTNYQASLTKGIDLQRSGVLNTDFSYAYSSGSPTQRKTYYQTFNLGLRWKTPEIKALKWNQFVSFRVIHSDDGLRHEPDEEIKLVSDVKSSTFQFGLSGDLETNLFLKNITYNINGSIANQRSFFEGYLYNGPYPIIEAMESGTYITAFSPNIFAQVKDIRGLPININARIQSNQYFHTGTFDFNLETGLQYSLDDNRGKGRVSNSSVSFPNMGSIGSTIGSRSATFEYTPASKTFSAYHQTSFKREGANNIQRLNLGLRYDLMLMRYNLFSPRLSFSTKHSNLNFRAAWGLSYKSPAMIQLHPGKSFIDYTNLNYYAENPNERFAIVTTYVYQPSNNHLKPNFTNFGEVGLDWTSSKLNLQVTFFRKELQRGIQHTDELLLLPRQAYEIVEAPENELPIVQPIPGDVTNIPRIVNVLKNNYMVNTNGIEFVLSGLKWNETNTELNFRYSYLNSLQTDDGFDIRSPNYVVGDDDARFGVYDNHQLRRIRSIGTLTLIQHIPALRFVLTLITELDFKDYRINVNASQFPYAYYDINGVLISIPESERDSPTYNDLRRDTNIFEPSDTPLFANFNLQIRKETRQGHSFGFYAYNAPWYNPEYEVSGSRIQLNSKLQVGFNLSLMLTEPQ